ncbi:putative plasma membrane antiporter [Aspergillus ruber CBS 135680]|uniref:Putative plasma membrane antiporter n=1 Tax=Aspergillus ruber (strain CBS 135680) TaxID=1388766 RepID=A0A017SEV0_ASPRC|nr:putative plasma membrane antiporter [Aspergillus ruber CBS 135680]EYE95149.1 putative plasma membrane antiporter [Aspergillus ruber CBS 135680]
MLHPVLDVTNLNIVLTFSGIYILLFGFLSFKIKQRWYLGETLPAFITGIAFGPVGARFLRVDEWGYDKTTGASEIAYGLFRIVIGIQLAKVGYELPKRYIKECLLELLICLLPLMMISWLVSAGCIMLMVPNISFLSTLIISSCIACTDPLLSQSIAKGPFSDTYVRRPLREFISAEAGLNDGFGFPFLLLAVSLLRYAETPENAFSLEQFDLERGVPGYLDSVGKGRFGGGGVVALEHWVLEGVGYMILLGGAVGWFLGILGRWGVGFGVKRRWIDQEGFLLVPVAMGFLLTGLCGCIGSDETLACFIAGCTLNWNGTYHAETQSRHDTFNTTLETLLNFATFLFLGAAMPWDQFHMPESSGLTVSRLVGLGLMVILFRRVPAMMLGYKFLGRGVCRDWREGLFVGWFGPIGIGAISYVEYARRLFPGPGESDHEINNLTAVMRPVVYWLVLFSIIVHGLSVPVLNIFYRMFKVQPVRDHPVQIHLLSESEPLPNNSVLLDGQRQSVLVNNQFSRVPEDSEDTNGMGRDDTGSIVCERVEVELTSMK